MLSVPGRLKRLKDKIQERYKEKGLAVCAEAKAKDTLCKQFNAWSEVTERHFGLYKDHLNKVQQMQWGFEDDLLTKGTSGTLFINPSNTLSMHDRMQQGVADLLNLTASISRLNESKKVQLNTQEMHFIGHSLGTIIGTNYALLNQQNAANTPEHPSLQGIALLTPGGGISRIMERSLSFRQPLFTSFKKHEKLFNWMPGSEGWETFALGTQTILDSVDAITHAKQFNVLKNEIRIKSMIVAEVVGGAKDYDDGSFNPSDKVIPNSMHLPGEADEFGVSLPSFFAGTEPLIAQMQLSSLYNLDPLAGMQLSVSDKDQASNRSQRHWVARLNQGDHLTPVVPFQNFDRLVNKLSAFEPLIEEALQETRILEGGNYNDLQSYLPVAEEFRQIIEEEAQLFIKLYTSVIANFSRSQMTVDLGPYLSPIQPDLPFQQRLVAPALFKPLPLFRCESDTCTLAPSNEGGFYGIKSQLAQSQDSAIGITQIVREGCLQKGLSNECKFQRGKKAKAKWRFQVSDAGVYEFFVNIPKKEVGAGSNCIAFEVFSSIGHSKQIRVNQVPARTTVVCRQAKKVSHEQESTKISLGKYPLLEPQQVYEVIVSNVHNPDMPHSEYDNFYIPPVALGSLTLKKKDIHLEPNSSQLLKLMANKVSLKSQWERWLVNDGPEALIPKHESHEAGVFSVGDPDSNENVLRIDSIDPRVSISGTWYKRIVDSKGDPLVFRYVDSFGGKIRFNLRVQQDAVYQMVFDKSLAVHGSNKGILDSAANMLLSIKGTNDLIKDDVHKITIFSDSEHEQHFEVKLLKGNYQFTFEAANNFIGDWGAYFGSLSMRMKNGFYGEAAEKLIDNGWEQITLKSGSLVDQIAWVLNLKDEGKDKSLVYEFVLSEAGQHKVLINLPGDTALGTCGFWTKERCGYEQVQVSLEKQDGTLIGTNTFDTLVSSNKCN
jgi:hypothetical protein